MTKDDCKRVAKKLSASVLEKELERGRDRLCAQTAMKVSSFVDRYFEKKLRGR